MGKNLAETVMGGLVLVVALMFIYFFINTAQVKTVGGYNVSAVFAKIGGLQKGSDVRMSGIVVGSVVESMLDPKTYDAVIKLSIAPSVKLPVDTIAKISSVGIMGGKYLRLLPGRATAHIKPNGMIDKTEDFKSLEDQVGQIIFLATSGDSKKEGK
jgi:phospholipid/cholesterol/gamma-HCH transport system substrate-binding protein